MKRFKLSKNIQVTGFDSYDMEDVPVKYRTGYFILTDQARDSEYIVPETIQYFVAKFSTPKTCTDVVSEVAADVKQPPKVVEETCINFIAYLRKKNILIPEDKVETKPIDKAFYKQGDNINQYTVRSVLDCKSGVDIYLVINNDNGCLYVVKFCNGALFNVPAYEKQVAAMQREYNLLQKATAAASISKAFHFEKDQYGNSYMVLEFIKGKPIFQFVEEVSGLTEDDYLLLMKSLLTAFAQLHQCGVVHGDVHSSNVMVARDKTVRIIDLGMSLQHKEIDKAQRIKHGGVYEYMPPERIGVSSANKFTKAPDFFSDVYQIGLLLYFLLYHKLPFQGFVWEDLSVAIKKGNATFPTVAAAGFSIPLALRRLVRNCMATEPQKRYADATEILKAYTQYLLTKNHVPLSHA